MRVGIYARVSTHDQQTLPMQLITAIMCPNFDRNSATMMFSRAT